MRRSLQRALCLFRLCSTLRSQLRDGYCHCHTTIRHVLLRRNLEPGLQVLSHWSHLTTTTTPAGLITEHLALCAISCALLTMTSRSIHLWLQRASLKGPQTAAHCHAPNGLYCPNSSTSVRDRSSRTQSSEDKERWSSNTRE